MKFFVIACLIAVAVAEPAAEAEADPAYLYGNNYAYGARAYAASPYYAGAYAGYAGYAAPAYAGAYRSAVYSPYAAYAGAYSPYAARYLGKRSAEAEAEPTAEADPAYLYANQYAYGAYPATYAAAAYRPYAATYASAAYAAPAYAGAYAAYSPYTTVAHNYGAYANAGRYYANSAGVVHVAKRSAEAEPTAEADPAYLYGNYGAYAGAYNGAYASPYQYGAYSAYASPSIYRSAYNTPYAGYGYNAYRGYAGYAGYGFAG